MTFYESQEKLAYALLHKPVNKAAIVLLGFYTTLWGLWVANPWWSVFAAAPLYSQLAAISPEWLVGCIAIFAGLVMIRGAYRRSYRALVTGASVAGWFWFMIAIFYFVGDWHNTGGITAAVFSLYGVYLYLNIRINHKFRHYSMKDVLS